MSEFSNYYENKIGDHMLRNQSFTPPTAIYLALFTAETGLETNSPTSEVTGTNYARQAITLDAFVDGQSSNSTDIEFPQAGSNWGTITHCAIVDHVSNTNWGTNVNVLMWSALTESKTVNSGEIICFSAGNLDVSIA